MNEEEGTKQQSVSAAANSAAVEAPIEKGPAEGGKGLSLRDALEVAIAATKPEVKADEAKQQKEAKGVGAAKSAKSGKPESAPRSALDKVAGSGAASIGAESVGAENKEAQPPLEPPAEYNAQERADFAALSRKGQEAQLRLDKSRKSKIEEIKRESGELQWAKDLAKEMTPFLKARGDKEPAYAQIVKALKVVNEVDSDTKSAVAKILQAKGIQVPKELLEGDSTKKTPDPEVLALREELKTVTTKIAQDEQAKVGAVLQSSWQSFESEKNAVGTPKFPDLSNTPTGLRLAENIGSLVRGDTELSKQFIASAKARIPGLNYSRLLEEAYRFSGGRVDDSSAPADAEAPRTQATQSHIAKSNRASLSTPGRGSPGVSSGSGKKFGSYKAAAAAALAEIRAREGD